MLAQITRQDLQDIEGLAPGAYAPFSLRDGTVTSVLHQADGNLVIVVKPTNMTVPDFVSAASRQLADWLKAKDA